MRRYYDGHCHCGAAPGECSCASRYSPATSTHCAHGIHHASRECSICHGASGRTIIPKPSPEPARKTCDQEDRLVCKHNRSLDWFKCPQCIEEELRKEGIRK